MVQMCQQDRSLLPAAPVRRGQHSRPFPNNRRMPFGSPGQFPKRMAGLATYIRMWIGESIPEPANVVLRGQSEENLDAEPAYFGIRTEQNGFQRRHDEPGIDLNEPGQRDAR